MCSCNIYYCYIPFKPGFLYESKDDIPTKNSLLNFSISLKTLKGQCRLQIKGEMKSCLLFYLLILQSGDVEVNLGPKYPCGICSKNVGWNG